MLVKVAILAAFVALSLAVQIDGCTGEAITFPLIDDEPELLESTTNGKKFGVGNH